MNVAVEIVFLGGERIVVADGVSSIELIARFGRAEAESEEDGGWFVPLTLPDGRRVWINPDVVAYVAESTARATEAEAAFRGRTTAG